MVEQLASIVTAVQSTEFPELVTKQQWYYCEPWREAHGSRTLSFGLLNFKSSSVHRTRVRYCKHGETEVCEKGLINYLR